MVLSYLVFMRRYTSVAIKKITIENVHTIPLGNPDLMDIIIGLAARVESLEKRIAELERRIMWCSYG